MNDAACVVGPLGLAKGDFLVERDSGFRLARGTKAHFIETVGCGGDDDVALDGEGQDEAVAIVDVFSDQIDATGCGCDKGGLTPEVVLEVRLGLSNEVGEGRVWLKSHQLKFGVIRKLYL